MSENENMMPIENPYEFAIGSLPPSLIYEGWEDDPYHLEPSDIVEVVMSRADDFDPTGARRIAYRNGRFEVGRGSGFTDVLASATATEEQAVMVCESLGYAHVFVWDECYGCEPSRSGEWDVDWSLTIRLSDGTDFRSEGSGASPALFEGLWQSLLHAVMEEPDLTGGFVRSEELCRWLTIA